MQWKHIQRHKRGRKGSLQIISLWPARRNAARGKSLLKGLITASLLTSELRNLWGVTACNQAVIEPGSVAKCAGASQTLQRGWIIVWGRATTEICKPCAFSGESSAVFWFRCALGCSARLEFKDLFYKDISSCVVFRVIRVLGLLVEKMYFFLIDFFPREYDVWGLLGGLNSLRWAAEPLIAVPARYGAMAPPVGGRGTGRPTPAAPLLLWGSPQPWVTPLEPAVAAAGR